MKTNDIRSSFLQFFEKKKHKVFPSDSLIPQDDTLLFTSAGMVQFKPNFISPGKLKRATSCQKCFRTPDLENVGKIPRYNTFFEMLGNFSFGDYFKKEAISWAWEYVTEVIKLPKDSIYISVYLTDREAFNIWNKHIGVPKGRIVRLGKEDNFWGPVSSEGGICGPCSELYIDFGEKYGCRKKTCAPGCDCNRYVEFWNLVFPSFNQNRNGNLRKLKKPGVDTGLGLERFAMILQGVTSNLEIDIIKPVVDAVCKAVKTEYKKDETTDSIVRIITDHLRAITFLIADGVFPSNEGRGYVLRRIIRRAVREAYLLNVKAPFLHNLTSVVADVMKKEYAELLSRDEYIKQVVFNEEKKFFIALERGMPILNEMIDRYKNSKIVSGEEVFRLYDTYGFPFDLTREMLKEKDLSIDEKELKKLIAEHQDMARKSWKGSGVDGIISSSLSGGSTVSRDWSGRDTKFTGYNNLKEKAKIIALIKNGKFVDVLKSKEEGFVVLNKTPFYAESGGQIGDVGVFIYDDGFSDVHDTVKSVNNLIIHKVKVFSGVLNKGKMVEAIVDKYRRSESAKHHTATHLLHSALRQVLGKHVTQCGSLVTPEKLRFDFSHFSHLKRTDIEKTESLVNNYIRNKFQVIPKAMSLTKAKEIGAIALFEEKYSQKVRVLLIDDISKELCGGTHVKNTADLGMFKITSEGSVSAGIRRIEAVVGDAVLRLLKKQGDIILGISNRLKTSVDNINKQLESVLKYKEEKEKEVNKLRDKIDSIESVEISQKAKNVNGITVISARVNKNDFASLRKLGDKVKNQIKSGVVVLGSEVQNNVLLICMVTDDLTSNVKAGEIIKTLAKYINGSGGGRDTMAQAGGKDASRLDYTLNKVFEII